MSESPASAACGAVVKKSLLLNCSRDHLDTTFTFNSDPARASELEISFHTLAPNKVQVVLEHRHIERHGEGYEKLRDLLDGGWVGVLGEFARFADPAAAQVSTGEVTT